ncbi:MAG: MFS transporter [Chloroflexota bacterium]|nr:MFS transporter [Chloroflexota bacterium]
MNTEVFLKKHEQWLYLVAFPTGHAAVDWGSAAFWLLAPAMALAMDLSATQIGVLFVMRQIGGGIVQLPAGVIGDSISKRGRFLLATFWWVAVAQLFASVSPGYWSVGVFLALASAGAAAWHPVAMGTMVQRMPDRRAFALAVHSIGGTVAEIVAPLLVGFLLVFLDWRQVLQISTVPAMIVGLMFLRLSAMVPASAEGAITKSELRELARAITRPTAMLVLLVLVLHNMSVLALMSMAPLYFQEVREFSSGLSGVAFAVFVISGAVAAPVIGRISDRAGRTPITLVGLLGGGISAWLITVAPGTAGIFALLFLTGFLMLTVRPVLMAMALETIGRREATVLGFISTIGEVVSAPAAAVAGMVADIDLTYPFILSAGLSGVAGFLVVVRTNSR